MVKNPPSNTGDVGSIPGLGTKTPYAKGHLSLCTAMKDPRCQHSQINKYIFKKLNTIEKVGFC